MWEDAGPTTFHAPYRKLFKVQLLQLPVQERENASGTQKAASTGVKDDRQVESHCDGRSPESRARGTRSRVRTTAPGDKAVTCGGKTRSSPAASGGRHSRLGFAFLRRRLTREGAGTSGSLVRRVMLRPGAHESGEGVPDRQPTAEPHRSKSRPYIQKQRCEQSRLENGAQCACTFLKRAEGETRTLSTLNTMPCQTLCSTFNWHVHGSPRGVVYSGIAAPVHERAHRRHPQRLPYDENWRRRRPSRACATHIAGDCSIPFFPRLRSPRLLGSQRSLPCDLAARAGDARPRETRCN